jgi:hypothetical protein
MVETFYYVWGPSFKYFYGHIFFSNGFHLRKEKDGVLPKQLGQRNSWGAMVVLP